MIRIKFRDGDGTVFGTMLLEDRPDIGPELRQLKAADCDAGPSQVLDVPTTHCNDCLGAYEDAVGRQLGLTHYELETLTKWRTAKQDGVSPAELGRILDRVCKLLNADHDCRREHERIVVEVEPTP